MTDSEAGILNLKRCRALVWLIAFALPAYWAFGYAGWYHACSEFQLRVTGAYLPFLSITVPMVILLIPAIYLTNRIETLITQGMAPEEKVAYYKQSRIRGLKRADWLRSWMTGNFVLLLFSSMLVFGAVTGAYFVFQGSYSGPLFRVEAEDLATMTTPPSRYLEVYGCAGATPAVDIVSKWRRGDVTEVYFPCVPSAGNAGKVAKLIVRVNGRKHYAEIKRVPVDRLKLRGLVVPEDHSYVAQRLRDQGVQVAQQAWILEEGASPEDYLTLGKIFLGVIGGLGGFGIVVVLLIGRSKRRVRRVD